MRLQAVCKIRPRVAAAVDVLNRPLLLNTTLRHLESASSGSGFLVSAEHAGVGTQRPCTWRGSCCSRTCAILVCNVFQLWWVVRGEFCFQKVQPHAESGSDFAAAKRDSENSACRRHRHWELSIRQTRWHPVQKGKSRRMNASRRGRVV